MFDDLYIACSHAYSAKQIKSLKNKWLAALSALPVMKNRDSFDWGEEVIFPEDWYYEYKSNGLLRFIYRLEFNVDIYPEIILIKCNYESYNNVVVYNENFEKFRAEIHLLLQVFKLKTGIYLGDEAGCITKDYIITISKGEMNYKQLKARLKEQKIPLRKYPPKLALEEFSYFKLNEIVWDEFLPIGAIELNQIEHENIFANFYFYYKHNQRKKRAQELIDEIKENCKAQVYDVNKTNEAYFSIACNNLWNGDYENLAKNQTQFLQHEDWCIENKDKVSEFLIHLVGVCKETFLDETVNSFPIIKKCFSEIHEAYLYNLNPTEVEWKVEYYEYSVAISTVFIKYKAV